MGVTRSGLACTETSHEFPRPIVKTKEWKLKREDYAEQ